MARLHKQSRAQPRPGRWLFSCVRVPRLLRLDGNIDAFVDLPLALILYHPDVPHLARVGHMCAAIRLQIETHDLYGTHLCYALWQQINLGTNQVRDLERLSTRQDADADVMPLLYFAIHLGLNFVDQLTAQRFK